MIAKDGRGIMANFGSAPCPAPIGATHVLSASNFAAAGADVDWLQRSGLLADMVPPFGVAFLRASQ